jgi:inorganic phosphate transporter, PiT family
MPVNQTADFVAVAQATEHSLAVQNPDALPSASQAQAVLKDYIRTKHYQPTVLPALAEMAGSIGTQVGERGSLARVPGAAVKNVRNDMYLASEAVRLLQSNHSVSLTADARANLKSFKSDLDASTKFIPTWVKVAVAIALGLGTMVGWKRIVVTVGEKIGKSHLAYGQGASAELVAMLTIGAADSFGLPVSTTHVLSSGVAGTMAANGSGLQWTTIRNLLMAWVLTLPAAIVLSGVLYWLFARIF